jgi:HTH-type transcriptional regulator / antitoxin HigA
MNIRPIKTESDYNEALAEIERLMESEPNTSDGDKLDVLTTLVEAYEEKHYPIDHPDPIEAIIHHMESQEITRKDLEQYIGNRARVSEVLNRKRPLSISMIRNLQEG